MKEPSPEGRGWLRAAGLLVAALTLSVVRPGVLIALPFLLLLVVHPGSTPDRMLPLLAATVVAVVFVAGTAPRDGIWYLERGWAALVGGWFVALTLRWPGSRFFSRALGAVVGAFAAAGLVFVVTPRAWSIADWMVADRMRAAATTALSAVRMVGGEGAIPGDLADTVYRTVETQGVVFPALLGLASLASLGVAWWVWVRLARGSDGGLGPLRGFRFHDQFVWVFVLGLALVLLGGGEGWERVGTNAVVFMGALYALRGMGVLLFLTGGLSPGLSLLLAVAFVFVAPVLVAGTVLVGLGDTWIDLRERARATSGPGGR